MVPALGHKRKWSQYSPTYGLWVKLGKQHKDLPSAWQDKKLLET